MGSIFTEAQWRWIAERVGEGYSFREIADFLGVHRETIRRGLVRRSLAPGNRKDLPPLTGLDYPGTIWKHTQREGGTTWKTTTS